ncbi:MAG: hypothetical protein EBS48_10435 [Actinobacteria bacterium]|nr:hypothetical protein [Actinomycetota bacterium]
MPTITIQGEEFEIRLPAQFAPKEELLFAMSEAGDRMAARLRVYAAMIGLCTDIGPRAKLDYTASRFDVLAYGGAVYGLLRENGVEPEQIVDLAGPIHQALLGAVFPREGEVRKRASFFVPKPVP